MGARRLVEKPRHDHGGLMTRAAAILFAVLALAVQSGPARAATILALGDSLTAGYGLAEAESLPAQLEASLRQRGLDVRIRNAGVSGDTTAGGLARVDWLLAEKPDFAIVALGANDGLRALDPASTYRNLDGILAKLRAAGVPTLLAGMLAPPNLGTAYGDEFNAVFPRLAQERKLPLYPFLLDGVAADRSLNQSDGIHPNAEGVRRIVERLTPYVLDLLKERR
ncbi:MAG: arylesterase [Alphaproteobacteria bacterium]|nr:arylesterase [Alphaproteobacteria bacterium]